MSNLTESARSRWTEIKQETREGANTATRVGDAGLLILDALDTINTLKAPKESPTFRGNVKLIFDNSSGEVLSVSLTEYPSIQLLYLSTSTAMFGNGAFYGSVLNNVHTISMANHAGYVEIGSLASEIRIGYSADEVNLGDSAEIIDIGNLSTTVNIGNSANLIDIGYSADSIGFGVTAGAIYIGESAAGIQFGDSAYVLYSLGWFVYPWRIERIEPNDDQAS